MGYNDSRPSRGVRNHLIVLMGAQFAAAEFVGAPLMVLILAFLFRQHPKGVEALGGPKG
jgi:hypothetical protein